MLMSTYPEYIQSSFPYDPTQFVEREHELRMIADRVRPVQLGEISVEVMVHFWGVWGIGKTWLIQHVQHLYAYSPAQQLPSLGLRATFTMLCSFSQSVPLETYIRDLAEQVLAQLGQVVPAEVHATLLHVRDSGEASRLLDALLAISSQFVPVILLDQVEQAEHNVWRRLEQDLIEPLIRREAAVVVSASRYAAPRWRSFELRRRTMATPISRLQPFSRDVVLQQFEQRGYRTVFDVLYPYCAGNPQLIDALVRHVCAWQHDQAALDQDLGNYQAAMLQILRLAETELLEHVSPQLRPIVYAIAPLRFYRIEALRFMLTEQQMVAEEQPDGFYLSMMRDLSEMTDLIWWDRRSRAYMISEVARQVINRRQLLEDQHAFAASHRQASQMYWGWMRQFVRTGEEYALEILFHLACLYQVDRDEQYLYAEIKKVLDFVRQHFSIQHVLLFQNLVNVDTELADLFPKDVLADLFRQIEQMLEQKMTGAVSSN